MNNKYNQLSPWITSGFYQNKEKKTSKFKKGIYAITFIVLALCSSSCNQKEAMLKTDADTEKNAATKTNFKSPSSFFPKNRTKVLVVGTFHMNYPGLDDHKTADDDKIDVLKEPKKSEMNELVAYIKKFKPTKIAIEAHESWGATNKLREYKNGMHRDSRDETYQIAMRIATELNLDTLYGVNARALSSDIHKTDSLFYNKLTDKIDWEREDPLSDKMKTWYNYDDKMTKESNLLDYFKYMNSLESHQYGYGAYLLGEFKTENNQGADFLSMWWYNRNLRIFRNIHGISEGPEDRIMVLMGNGHAAVLRQLIEASPEFDFIEFDSL